MLERRSRETFFVDDVLSVCVAVRSNVWVKRMKGYAKTEE
jgi:hypothetical protein